MSETVPRCVEPDHATTLLSVRFACVTGVATV